MSVEELRKQNVDEAKRLYEWIVLIINSGIISWIWKKKRKTRMKIVLSMMSFSRLLKDEYVFFNPKYFQDVINYWKPWVKDYPEVDKWIKIYEERLRSKDEMLEIGERIVDLSSSRYAVPVCLSMALEYETLPYWGAIMVDFRKLLNVLAPVKIGIFHLPAWKSTDRLWYQDEETGEITWESKVLQGDKPDQLVEDIKEDIKDNELEHSYTVYLITFVRAQTEKEVNLWGYLLWRESSGDVCFETLEPKTFTF